VIKDKNNVIGIPCNGFKYLFPHLLLNLDPSFQ